MKFGRLGDWRWWFGLRAEETLRDPPKMKIVAIIPAFDEEKHIEATVRALQNQTYPLAEIIVIDDCSSDNTGKIARALGVTVMRTPANAGTKARAQNFALKQIDAELFLTVDADTVLKSDAVYEAMRYFNNPNAQVVCGTVVPQRVETFWEYGRLGDYLFAQALMKRAQEHTSLVMVASGCFCIFRTETAREFGWFNERTYAEDMDMTWEIQNTGGRVYYARKAICYPVEPQNRKVYTAQMDRWYRGFFQNLKVRNYKIFEKKKSMAIMVYAMLLWYGISALLMPIFFYTITQDVQTTVLSVVMLHALMVWTPSMVAAFEFGYVKKAPVALICYMVIPYINLLIYVSAFVKEVVLGVTLKEWHKGH